MKKIIIAALAAAALSSCMFWNATQNNIIRTYFPFQGLSADMDADFYFINDGNFLSYSIDAPAGKTTEVYYYGTDNWYQYYFYDGTDEWGPAIILKGFNSLPSEGSVFYADEWGASIPDYCDKTLIYAPVAALKGNYGYGFKPDYVGIEVYDLQTWVDSIDIVPVEEDAVFADVAAPASLGSLDLGPYMDNTDSIKLIDISGNTLVVCSADAVHPGRVVFIDISTPLSPTIVNTENLNWFTEPGAYNFKLQDNTLNIYGNSKFERWDISTPAAPVKITPSFSPLSTSTVNEMSIKIVGNTVYALGADQQEIHVWDITTPGAPYYVDAELNSGYHYVNPVDGVRDSDRIFTVEGDKIYLPSGNNVEVFQYKDGALTALEYAYVGVPLKGVYKFAGDPYLHALGYSSINVVSVKN